MSCARSNETAMSFIDFFATHIKPRRLRGTGCLHPASTGWVMPRIAAIRHKDVNAWAVASSTGYLLFDTGYEGEDLEGQLRALDITLDAVRAVFLTHADMDHAGGLPALHRANPDIPVYCHKAEEAMLAGREKRFRFGPVAFANPVEYGGPRIHLRGDDLLAIDDVMVRVFHVPGHTPGHACYLVDDHILVSGDCLAFNARGGYCFFGLFNMDTDMNIRSLACLQHQVRPFDIDTVLSGHSGVYQGHAIFEHRAQVARGTRSHPFDPSAPYDVFAEAVRENSA